MPIPRLILRPFQPPDFDVLLAIDQACFPKTIAYGRREMKSYLQSEGAYCVVAEIPDKEIRAPAIFGSIAGFILTERTSEIGHIVTLDVVEYYRRHCIGSLLLDAAERDAASQGATRMYLETATTNKAAIALWKKHGYRETATIENYYGQGQNAFEMQKRLERKFK